MSKKFIEEEFPITKLSALGRKEKSTAHANITGIHAWWARRPTIISRALILSALIDYPENKTKQKEMRDFIIKMCSDFKGLPKQKELRDKLEVLINDNNNQKITLLDPFSGGSSIPLEAARLGLNSHGRDLNPVSVLIGKATCEYFQKFGIIILKELKKWWKYLRISIAEKLKYLYSNSSSENTIIAFIWAKQIKCQNSSCMALIPMLQTNYLVNKDGKKIVLKPLIKRSNNHNEIQFKIHKDDDNFNPNDFVIFSRGKVTCPACGLTIPNQDVMNLVKKRDFNDRLIVIVEKEKMTGTKIYRLPNEEDLHNIEESRKLLENYKTLIPKEKLPKKEIKWRVQNYGILDWKQFFNSIAFSWLFINRDKSTSFL